jgi:hypothetical protein
MTVNNTSTGDKDMTNETKTFSSFYNEACERISDQDALSYETKTENELLDIILESEDEEDVAAAEEERERRTTQLIADFKAMGGFAGARSRARRLGR